MAKVNPFLKKATGTSKAPVALDKKKHGLGRSVNFGGGVGSLLGAAPVVPAAVSQILELKINDIERSPSSHVATSPRTRCGNWPSR